MRHALAGAALAVAAIVSGVMPYARAQSGMAALQTRVDRLAAELAAGEDISALKRLQRAYGYYLDKGLWEDLSLLFTEDAVANYPAGIYVGRDSIREHVYRNVGGRQIGEQGLGEGRLYNHMNIQPVIHLDPGGQSAKGRWRAFAMFGSLGGGATWAEGAYEMTYAKVNGVWKIKTLEYHAGFGAPYSTGWVPPEAPRPSGARRQLPHPPDRERKMACEGFPAACVGPFHYENPGTTAAARVWTTVAQPATTRSQEPQARVAELAHRVTLLQDEQQIENLQRIYGYYIDRALWDEAADLFTERGTIEVAQQGVYVGKKRVRQFFELWGPQGLRDGWLNDHVQLQTLVTVAPDGKTARIRARELAMTGQHRGRGQWSEGIYENTVVKERGVWKIQSLHFYPTFISDYDQGWGKDAQPAPGISKTLPPDRPPTEVYEIYPKAHVPPYHYRNPVTGEPPHYPQPGGPDAKLAEARLMPLPEQVRFPKVRNIEQALATAERQLARVKDYHEIENLENAYGFYLDKNLWNDLADLFARDGSMELAQRGSYHGQARVREFLLQVFGRGQEGPIEGRLGNHMKLQPVIHVADDGQTAKVRARMFQQMNFGPRASLGGAIYENELVKEDGVWKFRRVHAYNTFTAAYEGGWAKSPSANVPGPSKDLPPDAPPSVVFKMFPHVYDIPFHYTHPVTRRVTPPRVQRAAATQVSSTPLNRFALEMNQ